jgi:hypothetical protein
MSIFIVEHESKGFPVFDTVRGVEDIDISMFEPITTLWVCDNETEVEAVESELRRKHKLNHETECGR